MQTSDKDLFNNLQKKYQKRLVLAWSLFLISTVLMFIFGLRILSYGDPVTTIIDKKISADDAERKVKKIFMEMLFVIELNRETINIQHQMIQMMDEVIRSTKDRNRILEAERDELRQYDFILRLKKNASDMAERKGKRRR